MRHIAQYPVLQFFNLEYVILLEKVENQVGPFE